MIKQIYFGMKDVKKDILLIILFILQITIITIFTVLLTDNLLYSSKYYNTINRFSELNLVDYNIEYRHNYNSYKSESINQNLIHDLFNTGKAYSFIDGISIDGYENIRTIVTIGSFEDLYGFNSVNAQPSVYIGSNVKDLSVGDIVTIGTTNKIKLTITNRLENDAVFFRNTYLDNLNDTILINMNVYDFFTHFDINGSLKYIFFENLLLINTDESMLHLMTKEINSNKEVLAYPRDYNSLLKEVNNQQIFNTLFFATLILIVSLFTFIGIVCTILNLIDKNLTAYIIHIMMGCTIQQIYFRLIIYILSIIIPSTIISLIIINFIGIKEISILASLLFIFLSTLLISIIPIIQLMTKNILSLGRRD